MIVVRIARLRKLAAHLMHGKLGHDRFDFWSFNTGNQKCGTAGCAIGECPIVFPSDWMFEKLWYGTPVLRRGNMRNLHPFISAEVFFGITAEECGHLFNPGFQIPALYGGKRLGGKATRYKVAHNIDEFIKIKTKNNK